MAGSTDFTVGLLDAAASRDTDLVKRLTELVNDVYVTAESGLWTDGFTRTTPSEYAELIASGQVVVAATTEGEIVGSVRLHQVGEDISEFGILVADPDRRGLGIGRALVDFAEQDSRNRGLRAIQLELLVPRTWRHPSKEFLKSWYGRRGFRLVQVRHMDDVYPDMAPLLATPCDLEVHEKPLVRERARHAD